MSKNTILEIEKQIDTAFETNPLIEKGYSQSLWTLLSVLEDYFFEISQEKGKDYEQLSIAADILMNDITHPIQVCYRKAKRKNQICYDLKDEDYQNALDWINLANHYNNYCTIFPMWHRSQIEVTIHQNKLTTNNWSKIPLQYEAYNRIVRKDGKKESPISNPIEIIKELRPPNVSLIQKNQFKINFNPKLVRKLIEFCTPLFDIRHILPNDWETTSFKLKDFKIVYITIQSMLYAWNVTRSILSSQGLYQSGYSSSVWIESKQALIMRLKRYTKIDKEIISKILKYLTFGEMGIKYPDIAIQPLIDMDNNYYALSPFLWLQSNSERNFCVLLNKIPEEKQKYSELTQLKEALLRQEIQEYIEPLGYKVVRGNLEDTDLDIAIIDHSSRACLAIELKWFIEPAEAREIFERSLELQKGIRQIQKVNKAFHEGDTKLLENILSINKDYDFLGIVGPRNWIGHFDVQDEEIPIIKIWHLLELIKENGSLKEIISLLKNRKYLPVHGENYRIEPITVECGNWKCDWYGIGVLDGYTKYSYK